MDLQIEIETLRQICGNLKKCSQVINETSGILLSHYKTITDWKGLAPGAYAMAFSPIIEEARNCANRLDNSASILAHSMELYAETEKEQKTVVLNLSADDIF